MDPRPGVDAGRQRYRDLIDQLVERSRVTTHAQRVRDGVWHRYVDAISDREFAAQMAARNELLASLSEEQREVLATMLAEEFTSGFAETLVVLYENEVPPFDDDHVYEGGAMQDFVGRIADWEWPDR